MKKYFLKVVAFFIDIDKNLEQLFPCRKKNVLSEKRYCQCSRIQICCSTTRVRASLDSRALFTCKIHQRWLSMTRIAIHLYIKDGCQWRVLQSIYTARGVIDTLCHFTEHESTFVIKYHESFVAVFSKKRHCEIFTCDFYCIFLDNFADKSW